MKIMRKFCTLLLILTVCYPALFAAGQLEKTQGTYTIGVSKIVTHPALDAIEQGMKDYLDEQGFAVTYDVQSANGDISTAASIAQNIFLEDRHGIASLQTLNQSCMAFPFPYEGEGGGSGE